MSSAAVMRILLMEMLGSSGNFLWSPVTPVYVYTFSSSVSRLRQYQWMTPTNRLGFSVRVQAKLQLITP